MEVAGSFDQNEIWDGEAAQEYDTPGTGMFAVEVLRPTVDRLVELAGAGRVLELAIGTGRIAVPLADRGVPVTGIELSRPMIVACRVDGTTQADFLPGSWDHRSASYGTTRRVVTPAGRGRLFDLRVLVSGVEVADDGVPGGRRD